MLPYVIHNRRDGGRVDGSLRLERLDVVQRIGIKQLRKKTNAQWTTRLNPVTVKDRSGWGTLAVLSLEAVMNMVRSTDVWMSLICLLCSFTFFRISPDCPRGIGTINLTRTKSAERATGRQRSRLFPPWRWTGWSLHFHGRQWQNLPEVPTQHWWSCAHCRAETGTAGCPLQEEKQHDYITKSSKTENIKSRIQCDMYQFAVDPSGQRSWGSTGNPSACLWRTWWCCRWNQSRTFWQPSWFRAGPAVYLCSNTHTQCN